MELVPAIYGKLFKKRESELYILNGRQSVLIQEGRVYVEGLDKDGLDLKKFGLLAAQIPGIIVLLIEQKRTELAWFIIEQKLAVLRAWPEKYCSGCCEPFQPNQLAHQCLGEVDFTLLSAHIDRKQVTIICEAMAKYMEMEKFDYSAYVNFVFEHYDVLQSLFSSSKKHDFQKVYNDLFYIVL